MKQQIDEVVSKGYRPVIFIAAEMKDLPEAEKEMRAITRMARQIDVPVFSENNLGQMHRLRKLYVFRYGTLPQESKAMVLRKQGVIVSGDLKVQSD